MLGQHQVQYIMLHAYISNLNTNKSCATIRPCGELWLVEECPYMSPLSPFHQPQLTTWANCGTNYDTRLIHIYTVEEIALRSTK